MNSSVLLPIIISLVTCSLIMFFVWLWAKSIKNAGVVDIFWSFNFPVIALIVYCFSDGFQTRKIMLTAMVLLWGIRLGTHLAMRVVSHLNEEEGRYAQLRKDWAPRAEKKFFWFFQAQGFSNVLLAAPFLLSLKTRRMNFRYWNILDFRFGLLQ